MLRGRPHREALLLLTVVLVTSCARGADDAVPDLIATDVPPGATVGFLGGLRTTPDGRGLVASYTGGACDGPAELSVRTEGDALQLDVVIGPDPRIAAGSTQRACADIGFNRTLARTFDVDVTELVLRSQGRQLAPFDGRRLLRPVPLPDGVSLVDEQGSQAELEPATSSGAAPAGPRLTDRWRQTYASTRTPGGAEGRSSCGGERAPWVVDQGPAGFTGGLDADAVAVGTATVGDSQATFYRTTGSPSQLRWRAAGGSVTVTARPACGTDLVPTQDELLAFARSLRSEG